MSEIEKKEQIDVFLAYREGESSISEINEWLKKRGVQTYYFHDTVRLGDLIDEEEALHKSRCMVVFLGEKGWGATQLKLVDAFRALGRPVLPVVVGKISDQDKLKLDGLFSRRLYLDLQTHDNKNLEKLLEAIKTTPIISNSGTASNESSSGSSENTSSEIDGPIINVHLKRLLRILADSSDQDRREALKRIERLSGNDRGVFVNFLRKYLLNELTDETKKELFDTTQSPRKLASVRSWMLSALIQLDAESSSDVVKKHLQQSFESYRDVRFWALAGLYGKNVSFERAAINYAKLDSEPEIKLLAYLMEKPADTLLVNDLIKRLSSDDFEKIRQVLRVLRIVPVLPLVPILSELLFSVAGDTALAYDVLYALASPPMAEAAAPILQARWTVFRVVQEIVKTTADSPYPAGDHFSILLKLFNSLNSEETIRALKGGLSYPSLHNSATLLLRQLQQRSDESATYARHRPGFHSDQPSDITDRLGIVSEAKTFAAIMMARDVSPPLAIGLFGPWGSGKSFFMKEMQRQAENFSKQEEINSIPSPFCTKVVQIEFNAWHYADSNLWASLVSCMLEKLHGKVNGIKSPADERADIEHQMLQAIQSQQNAVLKAAQAAEELRRKNEQLTAVESERHQRKVSINELGASDWNRLINQDNEAKKAIASIAARLGMGDLTAATTDWQTALSELRSQIEVSVSLARTVVTQSRQPLWIALFATVLAIPLIYSLIDDIISKDQEWIVKLSAVTAQISVMLTGSAVWLRKALVNFGDRRKDLEAARDWVNQLLKAKRSEIPEAEVKLKDEVESARNAKITADKHLVAAQAEVTRLESAREKISLARFLSDRHQSDDYRKQLGIFTTIRRDFEILVDRLKATENQPSQLDRIVLYIDDLDRCSADKVVEVLQAVHLLLAYPLFVVVVGVDSRWLLHSLSSHFKQFDEHGSLLGKRQDDNGFDHWMATPQHYLEKIFQIPYVLRPMTSSGFGQMIDALLKPVEDSNALKPNVPSALALQQVTVESSSKDSRNTSSALDKQTSQTACASTQSPHTYKLDSVSEVKKFSELLLPEIITPNAVQATQLDEAALIVQYWETEYAKRLHKFIPTPRAAKRFSNIYRIVKASVPSNELAAFEGSPNFPGEFRLPMILLSIQICSPHRIAQFSKFFVMQPSEKKFGDVIEKAILERSSATHSIEIKLQELLTDDVRDLSMQRVYHWLLIVERFSFDFIR